MNNRTLLFLILLFVMAVGNSETGFGANQTNTVSTIQSGNELPFQVKVELAGFSLPNGLHSFASATHNGKMLLIGGRTNGLHGFNDDPNNFPASQQNIIVYVVDPVKKIVNFKSLDDCTSGLSQKQIESLSVTSPQFYQRNGVMYIAGGYGVDTCLGSFGTKDSLSAIDIAGLMHWVETPYVGETALQYIRQIFHPVCKVTGGYMGKGRDSLTLLIFGQNYMGSYLPGLNGVYSHQIRRFKIDDDGTDLSISIKDAKPKVPDPDYRRRDLNVVPVIQKIYGFPLPAYVALSGVFTLSGGAWTVPVFIDTKGTPKMADPDDPATFKQGMNNYASAFKGMYSNKSGNMYILLFGGISYGYFDNGVFKTDAELPFINQITTVQLDKKGLYTQYLMDEEYPTILSTGPNAGNPLLFGAGAKFFSNPDLPGYDNGVLDLDKLGKGSFDLGYIIGGIQSTLPNTNTTSDSSASAFIFKVTLERS